MCLLKGKESHINKLYSLINIVWFLFFFFLFLFCFCFVVVVVVVFFCCFFVFFFVLFFFFFFFWGGGGGGGTNVIICMCSQMFGLGGSLGLIFVIGPFGFQNHFSLVKRKQLSMKMFF